MQMHKLFNKKEKHQMNIHRAKENIIPPKQVEKILDDVFEDLARMIACTIGPAGGNTLVTEPYSETPIFPAKDGFRVMNNHVYDDIAYESIYRIIRDICGRMNTILGDATTSGVIIAKDLRERLKKYLKKHKEITPFGIKTMLDFILKGIIEALHENNYIVKLDQFTQEEKIEIYKKIATISANNDSTIGDMVAEAYAKSGSDYTFIDIRESLNEKDKIQVDLGFEIPAGYIMRHMANDADGVTTTYLNPYYLIIDGPITLGDVPQLEKFVQWACVTADKPLVVIASEYCKEAMDFFVKCRSAYPILTSQGRALAKLPVAAIIVNTFSDHGVSRIQDLEVCLGAKALQTNTGRLQNPPETMNEFTLLVGRSDKIVIKPYETHILGGAGSNEERQARIDEIEKMIKEQSDASRGNIMDQGRIEYMKRRAGMLKGDMHCIEVGGDSFKEKKNRMLIFEDAILAVKSTIKFGAITLGGQVSLSHLISNYQYDLVKSICKSIFESRTKNIILQNEDKIANSMPIIIKDVLDIIKESSKAAYKKVFENATNDKKFMKKVFNEIEKDFKTYNLINGRFENFDNIKDKDIPDLIVPGNTDVELLRSVFAILGLFLTSNQLLTVIPAEEKRNKV